MPASHNPAPSEPCCAARACTPRTWSPGVANGKPAFSKRNPQQEEMQKLRRENQRLTEELRKAEIVIDVQKKVGALLGWPLPKADPEEKP